MRSHQIRFTKQSNTIYETAPTCSHCRWWIFESRNNRNLLIFKYENIVHVNSHWRSNQKYVNNDQNKAFDMDGISWKTDDGRETNGVICGNTWICIHSTHENQLIQTLSTKTHISGWSVYQCERKLSFEKAYTAPSSLWLCGN